MKTKIEIDTRTFIRFWLVIIGLVFIGFAIYSARTALTLLGVSFFLALALNPPVVAIARRLPGKSRVIATALAYVAVITVLGAIMFLVVPPIVEQSAKFIQTIPAIVDQATTQSRGLNELITRYNLQSQVDQTLTSIQASTASIASNFGQTVIVGIGSLLNFIVALFLVLVLTFLMLIEGPDWMKRIWRLYQNKARQIRHQRIVSKMYVVFTGYVIGQLTVSTIGAISAGLAVFILSFIFPVVPSSLAMPSAAIAFIMSLIPLFGTTIGGLLVTLLLLSNSVPAAVIYLIYFAVYQQIENNLISPNIQARRIDLSALAILAAITIGLYVFGLVGGIIAIPIAGCIKVLFEEYVTTKRISTVKSVKTSSVSATSE